MSGSIVGKIISSIILVIMCFILGAQVAESAKMSVVIIGGIVALVFALVLGPRCWMLIFLLPPILQILPLPSTGGIPVNHLLTAAVFGYWLLMWSIGHVKIRWRGLLMLDLLVVAILALMVASYIRRPVAILALGMDYDNVGATDFLVVIFAVIYYMALSFIPVTFSQVSKVLNWRIWLGLVCSVLGTVLHLVGFDAHEVDATLGEAVSEGRFGAFMGLGSYVSLLIYAIQPLSRMLVQPMYLFGVIFGFICIALSGFRSFIVLQAWVLTVMAYVKKELSLFICLGFLVYAGLLMISATGAFQYSPFGIQRALAAFPGMQVTEAARRDGEGSSEWRYEMWKWAMDSRTGYIRDYVWGDGFGVSVSENMRQNRAVMRKEAAYSDQELYAWNGQWHNTSISIIHRLGYVGLVVFFIYTVYMFLLVIRVTMSLKGTSLYLPALFYLIPFVDALPNFFVGASDVRGYFVRINTIALAKLLYCIAREKGLIVSWYQRRYYVPQMIQEHGQRIKPDLP